MQNGNNVIAGEIKVRFEVPYKGDIYRLFALMQNYIRHA